MGTATKEGRADECLVGKKGSGHEALVGKKESGHKLP